MKATTIFSDYECDVNESELVLIEQVVLDKTIANDESLSKAMVVHPYTKDFDRERYVAAYFGSFGEYVPVTLKTMLDNPCEAFARGHNDALQGVDMMADNQFLHHLHPDADDYSEYLDGYSSGAKSMMEELAKLKSASVGSIVVVGTTIYSGLGSTEKLPFDNALTLRFNSTDEMNEAVKLGVARLKYPEIK